MHENLRRGLEQKYWGPMFDAIFAKDGVRANKLFEEATEAAYQQGAYDQSMHSGA